jgi:HK97 family phage major capsid protein
MKIKKKYFQTPEGVLRTPTEEELKAGANIIEIEMDDGRVDPVDPMKQLEGAIRDLATDVKSAVEKQSEQLAAYNKSVEKRFPLGSELTPDPSSPFRNQFENIYEANAKMAGMTPKEAKEFFGEYDLAVQGKELQNKLTHPNHIIDEATRIEMAKFYLLMIRACGDPRAKEKFIDTYGMVKTNIGDAGNLFPLPKPLEAEILAFAREVSVLLQFARVWPMTSDTMSVPAESSSVTVGWGNTTPASDPAAAEVQLQSNELSAYSTVRNTTLSDSISDIVGWINSAMAEAAGLELDNQGFNGTGTPFMGILGATSGAGYSVTLAGSLISALSADDLSNMIGKLDGQKKQGARFYMHGQIIHIVRVLKDLQNRPIFLDGSIAGATPPTIYGYPYSECIKMPSNQAANSPFIAFGNLRYFAVGRRLDVATLTVNPWLYWTTNRTSFKLYQRWAMKMGLANGLVRLLTHG